MLSSYQLAVGARAQITPKGVFGSGGCAGHAG